MLIRSLSAYAMLLFGFFVIIPSLLSVRAQSCSNMYSTQTRYNAACPSNKGNAIPCNTWTTNEYISCLGSGGGSCVGESNLVQYYCQFGVRNSAGPGYRTCNVYSYNPNTADWSTCTACPYSAWSDVAGCGQNGCGPSDKQQRRTSGAGGSVCENQYRCATNTTYCVAPATPTVVTSSCSSPSNSSTAAWSAVSGATYYALRINKTSVGWNGACSTPGNPNGGNFCENVTGTSYSFTGVAGQSYGWWVHACNNAGCSGAVSSGFTCVNPINGVCGATNNACNAGTLSDTADSSTQYLWSCVGSNGGSNASCSQNKPINGVCSATLNACNAGTFTDTADSPTQYLWSCVGSNGGSNASCSQNKPTPTPTPTPTPPPAPYFKLKDTSFYKLGYLSSNFPIGYTAFDTSDNIAGGYFNQGEAGMVIASGDSLSAGAGGLAISGSPGDSRNWTALRYSGGNNYNSTLYTNYVKAKRKATPAYDMADIPASGTGGIYALGSGSVYISSPPSIPSYVTIIVNGDLTLTVDDLGKDGVVFIVTGNVIIKGAGAPVKFNSANRPFALISSGTIEFVSSLIEADGLFVGNAIDFGTGTNPLKIVGNVSASTASPFNRDRGTKAPSMFIVFDPRHLLGIIDKVSNTKTTWTQVQ